MTQILIAAGILALLGLLAGLLLSIVSALMAVPRDPKADALQEVLPGINCGVCGYSGCAGYAAAMASEGAPLGLCSPGGEEVARLTAEILGTAPAGVQKKIAVMLCGGDEEHCKRKLDYQGPATCAGAVLCFGGDKTCGYGCLGYGDCAAACEYGAIRIENGLARIDPGKCVGCAACVSACPKSVIKMTPGKARGVVRCSSRDKGGVTRKACGVGCIGCMRCVKACEYDAIHVEENLAKIDAKKCVGCGACAEVCPTECITIFGVRHAKTDVFPAT